jgi:hypothetical protein
LIFLNSYASDLILNIIYLLLNFELRTIIDNSYLSLQKHNKGTMTKFVFIRIFMNILFSYQQTLDMLQLSSSSYNVSLVHKTVYWIGTVNFIYIWAPLYTHRTREQKWRSIELLYLCCWLYHLPFFIGQKVTWHDVISRGRWRIDQQGIL